MGVSCSSDCSFNRAVSKPNCFFVLTIRTRIGSFPCSSKCRLFPGSSQLLQPLVCLLRAKKCGKLKLSALLEVFPSHINLSGGGILWRDTEGALGIGCTLVARWIT